MARSIAEKNNCFFIIFKDFFTKKIKPYANAGQVYHIRHAKCAFECPLYHSLALHDFCTCALDLVVIYALLREILFRVLGPAELLIVRPELFTMLSDAGVPRGSHESCAGL